MKQLLISSLFLVTSLVSAADEKFDRDRAAILAMAGGYEVEFTFAETVSLTPGYEIKKPYKADALELVKVVEDKGTQITLQHLLITDVGDVIKHWAQIWTYEDTQVLDYEGNLSWMPRQLSESEAKGTWTQFVTQVDDSPRYKAAGKWIHDGNYSAWTSMPSTRPLPRREYTKRSDYDLLRVVNRHIITPEGWVHTQDNRKYVRRNGENRSICLESGLNIYKRLTEESDLKEFEVAETYWTETHEFWHKVRTAWNEVITTSEGPVHYISMLPGETDRKKSLMGRMSMLASESKENTDISRPQIDELLKQHLR